MSTIIISVFVISTKTHYSKNDVSWAQSAGNQRRLKSGQVGTSETIRAATYSQKYSKNLSQWLAGVIDGDGSILLSKQGYGSIEITIGFEDLYLLNYIKSQFGGSVKARSGSKSYRYRIHNKEGVSNMISCINEYIIQVSRKKQLHQLNIRYNFPIKEPTVPNFDSNWFAGYFDADGTVGISMKNTKYGSYPQLTVQVTSKNHEDVVHYKNTFGGYIYYDTSKNGFYKWTIQSEKDISLFLEYYQSNLFKSNKSKRFHLIDEYYKLKKVKAYKPESLYNKDWNAFMKKWNSISESKLELNKLKI